MKITGSFTKPGIWIVFISQVIGICLTAMFKDSLDKDELFLIIIFFFGLTTIFGTFLFRMATSARNKERHDTVMGTLTGGDSYCYVNVVQGRFGIGYNLYLTHFGKLAVKDVEIEVDDIARRQYIIDTIGDGSVKVFKGRPELAKKIRYSLPSFGTIHPDTQKQIDSPMEQGQTSFNVKLTIRSSVSPVTETINIPDINHLSRGYVWETYKDDNPLPHGENNTIEMEAE